MMLGSGPAARMGKAVWITADASEESIQHTLRDDVIADIRIMPRAAAGNARGYGSGIV